MIYEVRHRFWAKDDLQAITAMDASSNLITNLVLPRPDYVAENGICTSPMGMEDPEVVVKSTIDIVMPVSAPADEHVEA